MSESEPVTLGDVRYGITWQKTPEDMCHCGEPVHYGYDGDPTHHRGMCWNCDTVRCDAYPGACRE